MLEQQTLKQRSNTTGEKLSLLQCFDALVEEENIPQNIASTTLGISLSCVHDWRSKKEALSAMAIMCKDKFTLHNPQGPSEYPPGGRGETNRVYPPMASEGVPCHEVVKVGQLRPKFGEKSLAACMMVILWFLARNQLTHCVATHKAQRCPGEVRNEALVHLEVQVP